MTKKFRQFGIWHLFFGTLLLSVFLFGSQPLGNLVSKWKLSFLEANAATVTVSAQVGPVIIVEPACNDTIDNDGDGLIDYPNDPGCDSASDTDEYNAPPGGGGGAPPTPATNVVITGKAYPESPIIILKDGQIFTTTAADKDANFRVQITNITAGVHTFGAWTEDKDKRKSLTYFFTSTILENVTTTISGIFLPPTIEISNETLARGEILDIFGQTAPESEINIHINSAREIIRKITATANGDWLLSFDTSPLEIGNYTAKAKAISTNNLQSIFSQALWFYIRERGEEKKEKCPKHADINKDKKVNLIDFSILLFNWGTKPKNLDTDFNCDGKVSLPDFSIMMYWWTG